MDQNQKPQSSSTDSQSSNSGTDASSEKTTSPSAPVPSPPPSPAAAAPPVSETAEPAGQTSAPANADPHEYRDIADGVQARVRTPEERAADAPSDGAELEGVEVTTARG